MNAANEERGLFVVVLDDEREQGEAFERAIGEALQGVDVEVERWKPNERDVDELEERERNFREYGFWRIEGQLVIDRADVLVVDWDLLFLKEGYKDAEPWAYLVRGFSRCKIVLMVNRWNGLPNPFDLGLRDDPFERNDQRSFADLDVGKEQLGMTWLWLGNAVEAGSFRPWYWPVVFQLVRDWDRRVEDVVGALLDDPCTSVHESCGSTRSRGVGFLGQLAPRRFIELRRVDPNIAEPHDLALHTYPNRVPIDDPHTLGRRRRRGGRRGRRS